MINRISIIAAVCFAALMVLPAVAFAQEGDSGDTSAAGDQEVTAPEPAPAEEPVVEEPAVEEPAAEEPAVEETVDDGSSEAAETDTGAAEESSSAYSSSVEPAVAQTAVSDRTGKHQLRAATARKSKKAGKSGKSCSASSSAGGPIASASAPVAPGCDRLEGNNSGILELPDGTRIQIDPAGQGTIQWTVLATDDGSFTLFVKGGPSSPGNVCDVDGAVVGSTGFCTTFVNPNSGQLFGVSHVDLCPRAPGTPPTIVTQTPEGDQDRGGREGEVEEGDKRGKRAGEAGPVATAAVVAPGEQLPFTGLPVGWLVLLGAGLLASGFAVRRVA